MAQPIATVAVEIMGGPNDGSIITASVAVPFSLNLAYAFAIKEAEACGALATGIYLD